MKRFQCDVDEASERVGNRTRTVPGGAVVSFPGWRLRPTSPLAIYRHPRGWAVLHIRSHRRVSSFFRYRREALQVAAQVEPLLDWTQDASGVGAQLEQMAVRDPEARERLSDTLRGAYRHNGREVAMKRRT